VIHQSFQTAPRRLTAVTLWSLRVATYSLLSPFSLSSCISARLGSHIKHSALAGLSKEGRREDDDAVRIRLASSFISSRQRISRADAVFNALYIPKWPQNNCRIHIL